MAYGLAALADPGSAADAAEYAAGGHCTHHAMPLPPFLHLQTNESQEWDARSFMERQVPYPHLPQRLLPIYRLSFATRRNLMPTNAEIAQALRDAGYVSDADMDAAIAVLEDALIVDEAEDIEAAAIVDKAIQKQTILDAELVADAAVAVDDTDVEAAAQAVIDEAFAAVVEDKMIIDAAEAAIDAAYVDAAAALVTAELIDEADAPAVAALLAALWLDDSDE